METFIIICLLFTSVIAITFIVERGLALREHKVTPQPVTDAVLRYASARDLPLLRTVCTQNPSPISRLLLFSSEHLDVPKAENSSLLETRARYELSTLERGLVVLEIIVGIAPLMGLVGTIYGLILLFGSMDAGGGANDSARFAAGISTALNATLLGLLIAIPALVAWSYYSRRLETYAVRMESLCNEFLRKQYHAAPAESAASQAPNPLR
jgi:biopolymer transport protein ExbB